MKSEKGQATAVVIGVAAVVILTLVGLGIYAYRNPTFGLYGKDDANKPGGDNYYDNGSSTLSISTSSSPTTSASATSTINVLPKATTTAKSTKTTTAKKYYYPTYSGPAYHNPTFGLTVPGTYNVTLGQNAYGGVPAMASYNFFTSGIYAFTINVFSKEQWNNIRIQETINAKDGTGPDYLGEGRYLGENATWIFSVVYGSYQPSGVRFY